MSLPKSALISSLYLHLPKVDRKWDTSKEKCNK